jgi:hypothetical protein
VNAAGRDVRTAGVGLLARRCCIGSRRRRRGGHCRRDMHIRAVVVVNTGLKFNSGAWLDDSLHGSQQQQTCVNSKKANNNAGYIFLYGEPRGARARTDVQLHAPGHVCFVGKEEESGKREEMEWYPLGPTTEL